MSLAIIKISDVDNVNLNKIMDEHGYVIIEDALSKEYSETLQNELEPYFDERKCSQALFFGSKTKRIEALFSKSSAVRKMAVNSHILSIADFCLGENCDNYHINLTQGIRINPGEKAQILHPDTAMYPLKNKPFEFQINAIWAYNDFTKENGATQVVPGSHKWPEGRMPLPHEIQYAEMKAGSVLVYQGSLIHGGGANISNISRTGIAISYCLGWLRQSENQYLSYPPHVAADFSSELQRLIGYNVHRPNLGWAHGHDPITLITGETRDHLGAEEFLTDEQIQLADHYEKVDNSLSVNSIGKRAA